MVVTIIRFYWRLIAACALILALIWSLTVAVFVFLSALFPGEDHDFEGPGVYVVVGGYLFFAFLSGFLLWRYRRWFLTGPHEKDV